MFISICKMTDSLQIFPSQCKKNKTIKYGKYSVNQTSGYNSQLLSLQILISNSACGEIGSYSTLFKTFATIAFCKNVINKYFIYREIFMKSIKYNLMLYILYNNIFCSTFFEIDWLIDCVEQKTLIFCFCCFLCW